MAKPNTDQRIDELRDLVVRALEDVKASDIKILDVRGRASYTDVLVIASGSSQRQVKALADRVAEAAKAHGIPALGVEGEREAEWILVDLGDVVVHVMLPRVRDFYNLERLWGSESPTAEQA
jgi:ribosome-associated protein